MINLNDFQNLEENVLKFDKMDSKILSHQSKRILFSHHTKNWSVFGGLKEIGIKNALHLL